MSNVRECALNSVIRTEKEGRYSNIELDSAIKKYGLEGVDKAFFTALVYGVIEKKLTLDYVIAQNTERAPEELDVFVLNILRLGAYQILFLDRTPDSAAVNESVEMAKRRCKPAVAGFVNAVLRSISRRGIVYPDRNEDIIKYFSVYYSVPEWICRLWTESYGEEKTEEILRGTLEHGRTTLRANTLKISAIELAEKLSNDGIKAEADGNAVILHGNAPVDKLYLDEGLCYIQDLSSQICSKALEAKPGETVIDTCACPGGKSFYIAIDMQNLGRLYSFDIHENKLSLIDKTSSRLGTDIIKTCCVNAKEPKEELFGTADRVICDVPCSGLGVLAKKPDIRYKKEEEISKLPSLQLEILSASAKYLKAGGRILYSTCTLNNSENGEVVKKFLASHEDFILTEEKTFFPTSKNDGFYYAVMQNKQ